jgi:Icc-related predicted phosphoesterase
MKIACISDVHGRWSKLQIPEVDLLISCGDYSFQGERHMVKDFHKWLNKRPAKNIISIQGNHELWVEKNFQEAKQIALEACPKVHFVEEDVIEIEGVKIFCSAYTPWFHSWAYNEHRGEPIKRHWDRIPQVDIIATHGPVYGILDELVYPNGDGKGEFVGCQDLLDVVKRIKPDLFFCGHIHAHGGKEIHRDGTSFYNTSICDEQYVASNPATIVDYVKE